ncbi:MAG: GGDEF domain-containing protein [Spirochaetaceae bacterium]|nr:GGDEF domain-containing protein [Spirochaetaceae bacterium]
MSDIKEKIALLSHAELFKPCGKEMVEQLAEFCSLYKVSKGETVFRKGDPGNSLYIVKSGEISVIQNTESRQENEIARYSNGDFFGEVDMLMNTQRNAEARAAEDSEILRFPREDKTLQDFLHASPPVGAELLRLFMQTAAARIRSANALLKENSPWVQEIRAQVYRDKLTGLYNRTFLEEQLPAYLRNPEEPVSLMMMKADNFKFINDNFGHDAGDQALVVIGTALLQHIPANSAVVVRFMGNEIACLFPGTNREAALEHAQSIRSFYNSLDMSAITKDKPFNFTVSIGIAVFPDHAKNSEELIACAHELPLLGRYRGGNKILFPEDK